MRTPLVLLVWSPGGLPFLTIAVIWADPCRAEALPTFTSAATGLTTEPGIDDIATSIRHQVTGGARVIRVDNVEDGRTHSECAGTMVVGIAKKKEKFPERSACFFEPMVAELVGQ